MVLFEQHIMHLRCYHECWHHQHHRVLQYLLHWFVVDGALFTAMLVSTIMLVIISSSDVIMQFHVLRANA